GQEDVEELDGLFALPEPGVHLRDSLERIELRLSGGLVSELAPNATGALDRLRHARLVESPPLAVQVHESPERPLETQALVLALERHFERRRHQVASLVGFVASQRELVELNVDLGPARA